MSQTLLNISNRSSFSVCFKQTMNQIKQFLPEKTNLTNAGYVDAVTGNQFLLLIAHVEMGKDRKELLVFIINQ